MPTGGGGGRVVLGLDSLVVDGGCSAPGKQHSSMAGQIWGGIGLRTPCTLPFIL